MQAEGGTVLSGDAVFDLFTTYGFPVEIEELAEAEGCTIDMERFNVYGKFAVVSKDGREFEVFTSSALQEASLVWVRLHLWVMSIGDR